MYLTGNDIHSKIHNEEYSEAFNLLIKRIDEMETNQNLLIDYSRDQSKLNRLFQDQILLLSKEIDLLKVLTGGIYSYNLLLDEND